MKGRRPGLVGALLWLAAAASAAPPPGLEQRADLLVREGFDRPAQALLRLQALELAGEPSPASRRVLLQARGMVLALAGRAAEAAASAGQLMALSHEAAQPLAEASALLVRALVAETAGQLDVAASLAQPAADRFRQACAAPAEPCDYRAAWRALHVLERRSMSLGHWRIAAGELEAASAIAAQHADGWRQAQSLSLLAYADARSGKSAAAAESMSRAWHVASALGDGALMARVRSNDARLADLRGERALALRSTEEALALARRAGAVRLQATLLGNASDLYAKLQRPHDALRAAAAAMPTVRRFGDQRAERVLVNNAGLAKIGLGRIEEGKRDLARLLELWRASGAVGDQAASLREFGEALFAAGDARGALELYHQERRMTADTMQRHRDAALKEMQSRYDRDATQRSIELLNRDSLLKSETLASRDALMKGHFIVAAALALFVLLAAVLYRRVRRTQRQLQANQVLLREHSERDSLTHLANRRRLHAVMGRGDAGYEGVLMLLDIDHFKRINDQHGHAVGDAVLVEFGRRLSASVRAGDLVVRWGGEEFLLVSHGLGAAQSQQLAARVLDEVVSTPFQVAGRLLRVTASIGYGAFPLAGQAGQMPWQQGLNLVDGALYAAKREGRNRAMGLLGATQPPAAADLLQTCGAAA